MSGNSQNRPPVTPAAEAHQRLRAADFTPIQDEDGLTPHGQKWQNRHGKVVYIDFTDETLSEVWTESLEAALKQLEAIPAHPWSSWWRAILGEKFRPS